VTLSFCLFVYCQRVVVGHWLTAWCSSVATAMLGGVLGYAYSVAGLRRPRV